MNAGNFRKSKSRKDRKITSLSWSGCEEWWLALAVAVGLWLLRIVRVDDGSDPVAFV